MSGYFPPIVYVRKLDLRILILRGLEQEAQAPAKSRMFAFSHKRLCLVPYTQYTLSEVFIYPDIYQNSMNVRKSRKLLLSFICRLTVDAILGTKL